MYTRTYLNVLMCTHMQTYKYLKRLAKIEIWPAPTNVYLNICIYTRIYIQV